MAGKIFINYRRDDAAPWAGRIYERLTRDFDKRQLFMDVDNIAPGLDFVKVLEEQVSQCDVLLAVIGKHWLSAANERGERRLDDPGDFVRIEIESALKRNVRVIPVLVESAAMPNAAELPDSLKPLARRQAYPLTHARFGVETQTLISEFDFLRDAGADRNPSNAMPQVPIRKRKGLFFAEMILWMFAAFSVILLVGLVTMGLFSGSSDSVIGSSIGLGCSAATLIGLQRLWPKLSGRMFPAIWMLLTAIAGAGMASLGGKGSGLAIAAILVGVIGTSAIYRWRFRSES
jgi:hypothetical protein